jgi:endonuclease/exonuclease/phosphatase family metal-dependent hydrolase
MRVKVLHLNIWNGTFLPTLIDFIKQNDFDIVHLQEVSGGSFSRGGVYDPQGQESTSPINHTVIGVDCFEMLQDALPGLIGEQAVAMRLSTDKYSYEGNATFVRKGFPILHKEIIWLKKYVEYQDMEIRRPELLPRNALALKIAIQGKEFAIINAHLAWGPTPTDEDYKLEQAKTLYNYIKNLAIPFILTGDFNVTADTEIVSMFSTLGRNVTREKGVTNTLNPRVHKAAQLFPPGLAVDYIITHPSIQVIEFKVVEDIDLSDHLALTATVEL